MHTYICLDNLEGNAFNKINYLFVLSACHAHYRKLSNVLHAFGAKKT